MEQNKETVDNVTPKHDTTENKGENNIKQETSVPVVETPTTDIKTEEKANKEELPKGVKKELWELRKKVRELNEQLKQKAELNNTTAQQINLTTQEEADLLADPKKWEQSVLNKLKTEVRQELYSTLENKRIESEKNKALEYLIEQPELSDENFKEELVELLSTPEYVEIEKKFPLKAAKMAYMELKEIKGITNKREKIVNTALSSENTLKTNSVKSVGKPIYKKSEIESILAKNPEMFDDILQAAKEGRVK